MKASLTALRWIEITLLSAARGLFMCVVFGFAVTLLLLFWCAGALGLALDAIQGQPQA